MFRLSRDGTNSTKKSHECEWSWGELIHDYRTLYVIFVMFRLSRDGTNSKKKSLERECPWGELIHDNIIQYMCSV
jgi:hypothetical protein